VMITLEETQRSPSMGMASVAPSLLCQAETLAGGTIKSRVSLKSLQYRMSFKNKREGI